jgi:hypothetical protein
MAAFMRKLGAGNVPDTDVRRPWTLTSPPGIPPPLLPVLQSSGDFTKLADALRATPTLLYHPLVYVIINHLRNVQRAWTYEDESLADEARTNLREILEAVASGLLGGGIWSLKPPPKRVGRKSVEDSSLELKAAADSLMDLLKEEENRRRRRNESEDDRAVRVARIVERVWARSQLSTEYLGVEPPAFGKPGDHRRSLTIDDLLGQHIRWKPVPLPSTEEVVGWVKSAYEQSQTTGRPVRSQLVWKMLAHRYGLGEDQVRGRIDTARAWEKKHM